MKLLSHEDADRQVEEAMGAPGSSAMSSFQKFLSNRGANLPQPPTIPNLPKESIKKLPLKIQ